MTTQPQQAAHHDIELPDSWRWLQLRRVASCISRSLPETTDPLFEFRYLDIGSVGPGRLLESPVRIVFKDAPSRARRTVSEGDVIVSTVRPYLRAVLPIDAELSDVVVSTGFAVFRPRDEVSSAWLGYAMQSAVFIDSVVRESKGVAYPAVTDGVIARTLLPVPPEGDQRQIARYLDSATAEIEKAVVAEHRLMSLLEEEKQAILSSAVTGHIGNGRQMVDSGLGWLGTIPDGWKLCRLKTLLKERNIRGFEDEPLLAATQAHGVIRKDDYAQRTVVAEKDLHLLKLVEVGDFVISLRSFEGGIEYSRARGIISPAYTVLSCADPALRSYLRWLFKSKPFIDLLRLNVTGIREGQNIDYSRLSRERVPVPPRSEQIWIDEYLRNETERIDEAILHAQQRVVLLEEYRARLIADVITGKLDVRELADDLPELEVTESSVLASREGSQLEDVV